MLEVAPGPLLSAHAGAPPLPGIVLGAEETLGNQVGRLASAYMPML